MPSHLHRYQETQQTHFVTFSCYRRRRYFTNPKLYRQFVQTLEDMRRRFGMFIYGYVVMPEHVHLLLSEPDIKSSQVGGQKRAANLGHQHQTSGVLLADAIHYLKLAFTKRVRMVDSETGAGYGSPQVSAKKREANLGHHVDADLGHQSGRENGSFWEKRYYDRNVRDWQEFVIKLRYLHRNPVKRGLVREPADWPWSSFRHYALREKGVVEIESEWTARDREIAATGGPARVFLPL